MHKLQKKSSGRTLLFTTVKKLIIKCRWTLADVREIFAADIRGLFAADIRGLSTALQNFLFRLGMYYHMLHVSYAAGGAREGTHNMW